MTEHSDVAVQHEPESSRYVLVVNNVVRGEAAYTLTGSDIRATHTLVDPALRGRGLGDQLITAMIADIRERTEFRVVPECSFVVDWFAAHPDERDLLTRHPTDSSSTERG
ncbi:GNAT family N-acetyltransferase [Klugiella xanthotipulae]|uniref:N-acetyltransferase domain-containing protein n=1 Tax=Klugiella xanthotipulae TaxID=244735 RepID=A0A543I6K6_9MICO|nr:GNAT family N-acetyltransferase [Klugiella xanthotipulae]TQM66208.1 hypothetical protein FB466_1039 [Klugiella xanthotipulae]